MDWKSYLDDLRKEKNFNSKMWVENKCNKFNNFLKENNLSGAVLSVSGGIDSAVTLALLNYTKNMENSNLKKIYIINQPIHSSSWAFNRAKELCDKFKIDMITIDQSDIHTSICEKVENQLKYKSNDFSKGQLRSYMRTPINYYLAQSLTEQGYPSIVIGTGNKDEDGYLAYFCKYGDGAVDIQLISDLHKNEVFQVGKFLEVPNSILSAPPSADLWDNQEDEKELGFSYDFIEFFTDYYLNKNETEQNNFIQSLNESSRNEFLNWADKCKNIHERNKHKLNGVINL